MANINAISTATGLYAVRRYPARPGATGTPQDVQRRQAPAEGASPAAQDDRRLERGPADQQGGERLAVNPASKAEQNLSADEKREVEQLKKRDREVKAHEQAHLAASGGHAMGGAQYTYQMGPDGKRYAVGGEVPIDASEVPNDPRATILKAQTIRRAAMAPANPSAQDRAVAAEAAAMATRARQELLRVREEGDSETDPGPHQQAAAGRAEARPSSAGSSPSHMQKSAVNAYSVSAPAPPSFELTT